MRQRPRLAALPVMLALFAGPAVAQPQAVMRLLHNDTTAQQDGTSVKLSRIEIGDTFVFQG